MNSLGDEGFFGCRCDVADEIGTELLTESLAQCAYARILFVPLNVVARTLVPMRRCHSKALHRKLGGILSLK